MGHGFRVTDATLDVLGEVLLDGDDELYGLKIAKAAGRPTGSVFPILGRLEQMGWVVSEWESSDPAARVPGGGFTGSAVPARLEPASYWRSAGLLIVAAARGPSRLLLSL